MTKVSVFGQSTTAKEINNGIKIIFKFFLLENGALQETKTIPSDYDNVQLIYKGGEFDTMLAWDDNGEPTIFLGHWNDGFVK